MPTAGYKAIEADVKAAKEGGPYSTFNPDLRGQPPAVKSQVQQIMDDSDRSMHIQPELLVEEAENRLGRFRERHPKGRL